MSVKRIKKDATFELVSVHDDAIDTEKSDTKAYKKALDRKHLVMLAGKQPTLFVVRGVTQLQRAAWDDEHIKVTLPEQSAEEMEKAQRDGGSKVRPKVSIENSAQLTVKYFEHCFLGIKEWDGKKYGPLEKPSIDEFPTNVVSDLGDQCQVLSQLGEPTKNG